MKITVLTLGRGINGDALRLLFVSGEQVIAYNKFPGIVILLGRYTLSIFIASFGDLVWFVLFPPLPFHLIVNKESLLETGVILSLEGRGKIPIVVISLPCVCKYKFLDLLFHQLLWNPMLDIKMMLIWNNVEENPDFKNAHFLSDTIVIHFFVLSRIILRTTNRKH